MSTRSRIGIVNSNGSVESVYCHHDGYLSGVGKVLIRGYMDPDKIRQLVALGDLSSLHEALAIPGNKLYADVTVAYMRDFGEKHCHAELDRDIVAYLKRAAECNAEYAYLWDHNNWFVWCYPHPPQLVADALAEEQAA